MSEPETLPGNVHAEAALLPWYANGTLGDGERRQVAGHLATCAACRTELEELQHLKADLTTLYSAQPGPSPNIARSLLGAVAQDAAARRAARADREPWIARVDQWLRALFLPRWMPTVAATILIAQIGLLLWTTMPSTQPGQVVTRSLGMPTARVSVAFQDNATEEQIRSLLQAVRGRIVDGPNPTGFYTIEILSGDTETSSNKLGRLRERTDVVRSAEIENP